MLRDLRVVLRGLKASPGFTAGVILTLALGIGANTTMFSVLDALLFEVPTHVRAPDRVERLYFSSDIGNGHVVTGSATSLPTYEALRSVPAFQSVAASDSATVSLGQGADARPVRVRGVTASYFSLLGTQPALGRLFDSDEDLVGAPAVAVVSYRYWRRVLQGERRVLGRTLPIGKSDYVIVGVAPKGFTGGDLTEPDIWLPLRRSASDLNIAAFLLSSRFWSGVTILARLAPGVTPEVAAAQATLINGRSSLAASWEKTKVLLRPIQEARSLRSAQRGSEPSMSSDAEVALWLSGLACAVLLVACGNIANLLLARGLARRRDLAVRLALGAGRVQLVRHMLLESCVLAAAGGASGWLVAVWGSSAVRACLLPSMLHSASLLEPHLLLFTVLTATFAGVVAGSIPAWHLSGTDATDLLRSGGRDATEARGRLRSGLLAIQVALTLVLLVGAGLFVRSLRNAETLDYGVDLRHVLVASIDFGYSFTLTDQLYSQDALYLRLLRRVQSDPLVVSAAASVGTPYSGSAVTPGLRASGHDSVPGLPFLHVVTADYFAAVGIPILRGRGFTDADDAEGATPVAVVGSSLARLIAPGQDALGQCLFWQNSGCIRVVGVVGDTRSKGIPTAPPSYYVPYNLHLLSTAFTALLVRTRVPAARAEREVRTTLQTAEPDVPYIRVEPLVERIAPSWRSWQLGAAMFSAFGLLALAIAAIGIYALTAYGVTQRTREIGVRMALGAQRNDVVWLVVRQTLGAAALGAAVGLPAALVLSRAMRALLFQVQPADPLTLVASAALLLAVAAAAAFVPVRRAVRADPVEALHHE